MKKNVSQYATSDFYKPEFRDVFIFFSMMALSIARAKKNSVRENFLAHAIASQQKLFKVAYYSFSETQLRALRNFL